MKIGRRLGVGLGLLLTAAFSFAHAQDPQPEFGTGWTDKTSVSAEKYMVAAANPHAVRPG